MGSGKSTIASIISKKTGYKLYELDKIFEQQKNCTIKDFFKNFGEEKFREVETQILKEICDKESIIISCGGGIILKKENREILFNSDVTTIYLEANSKNIYNRIKTDSSRPLLQVANPKEEIEKLLDSRKSFYELAQIKIKTDDKIIEEIVQEILREIWKN
jgi:shikimate kinase